MTSTVRGETRNELIQSYKHVFGDQYMPRDVHTNLAYTNSHETVNTNLQVGQIISSTDSSITAGIKRKYYTDKALEEPPLLKKVKFNTNNVNNIVIKIIPYGFIWDNNSCAYDSLFTIMQYVWHTRDKGKLAAFFQSNLFMSTLFEGFKNMYIQQIAVENIRDLLRNLLVIHKGSRTFGHHHAGIALFDLLETMFDINNATVGTT